MNPNQIATDSPELINIKSWQEFHSTEEDEQKKTYENLLAVIRRLLIERNESIQVNNKANISFHIILIARHWLSLINYVICIQIFKKLSQEGKV